VVEAGSLGDYRWAGNRRHRGLTEACLCPWPHFDQCPEPSCIRQSPREQLALRGELLYSTARAWIRVNNIRAAENPHILAFPLQYCTEWYNETTGWDAFVVSG